MSMVRNPFGAILRINILLLGACLLALIAWTIWPPSREWWGFGVLSIILGMTALGALLNAVREIAKLHAREKVIARMEAISRPAEQTEFADLEALKHAGMIDD